MSDAIPAPAKGGVVHLNTADALKPGPASRRWAQIVADVIASDEDVPTIAAWSHKTPHSFGTIKTWCANARVTPGDSLDFGRLYRAVLRHDQSKWDLLDILDIADNRTLIRLLHRAQLPAAFLQQSSGIDSFLKHQGLITSPSLIGALTELLSTTVTR